MSEYDSPDFFDPVDEINRILSDDRQALPSVYKKLERLDVVGEGSALVASANKKTLPTRRVGRFEMLEVLERSLSRTVLNIANPGQRVFTAIRELSDFVNMATTGAQPKISNAHRDLLPVGHPLSTKQHNFSAEEVAQARADWMSADPRIAEEFRPLVASAFVAPASSIEREYVIAKLEATSSTEVPRDIILGLTADADPYGGGNSFLARSARAKAQRRDRKGRFAYMGGGAKIWLGKQFSARSTLFRFAGYDSKTDSFDLEGLPNTPYQGKVVSVPASKVEAIKAILPELPGLKEPASKSVAKDIIVDPSSLTLKDAPTGWTKVSSENGVDTFRSADGWIATRYPNSASAPNEPSITRVRGANVDKSIDPDLPVYHIAKGSNDGLVTDKPFASTQSWGDTQALISRYDKKTNPKPKATLEEQPEEFLEGWTKDERGYIPADYNPYGYYESRRDPAIGNNTYTDPSGRFIATSMAPEKLVGQQPRANIEAIKKQQQDKIDNVKKYVAESGKPVSTFDGAKEWDGDVSNLWRLEKVRSDGKKEIVGYYQDIDDIERDTEIPKDLEQGKDFYEEVIANTLQYGGNSVDFVDGSSPEQGYLVAHEADVLKQDGTIGKREQLVSPKDFMDPVDGPKILRDYVLKNQEKLMEKGFYLGTWTDTVEVKDENGNVTEQKEMVFLDVSEYVEQFDDAIDAAEKRGEIAIYGAAEGKSYYTADEMKRREVIRSTPKFDEEKAKEVRKKADEIIDEEDKWFRDNRSVWENFQRDNRISLWSDTDGNWESPSPANLGRSEPVPNPEVAKISPEIYGHLKRRFDADKSRKSVFEEYIRSVFEMSDGMDPGGRLFGLDGRQDLIDIRNRYVGDDDATLKMNAKLREGEDASSRVKSTDRLVNKSKFKQDTLLYRGAWLSPELVDEMEIGDFFFDRGFQSAGLDVDTANGYLDFRAENSQGKKRVVFRVLAPKGMNAIHVGDDEVIMRRNTKMTIVRKTELNGTTYIDVDTEPQTKEEINARIQGRVPRPEPSESSSELPANDGGGADGLGDGGTPPVNYSPESTVEGPDSERVTDPRKVIWDNLLEDVGIAEEDVIEEAINMMDSPERTARQMLKDQVATSLKEKLADVSDQEFVDLSLSGLSEFMDKKDFGFDGTRSIDLIGVIEMRKRNGRNIGRYTSIESLVTNGAVPRNFPKDLVDRLNTGKITRKDAEEVVRLLNEFRSSPPLPNEDKLYIPSVDDKEFMDYLRYKTVSSLVGAWSSSSNGTNPLSLAIQSLAEKEFGIKGSAEWDMNIGLENEVKNVAKNNENIIRKFLRAQYDATQEYFQKKGISKVTLYRGIKEFIRHDIKDATFPSENGFVASIKLRPLSSWTTSIGVANRFRNIDKGKMFRKEFDVKDILSTPGTGVGCLPEEEFVTLGGIVRGVDVSAEYKVEQLRVVFPSPETPAITYKEDQVYQEPDLPVNNAPYVDIPPSEDEPDPDEINIFDLENPDYSAPGFYKFEIAKNLAETDEMREVSDSEMVDLSDWFGLFSTDDLDWGEDEKKEVGSIKLLSLDQSEFGEGEWGGEYEFTDLLYDIEQNIRFGGVEPFKKGSVLKKVMDGYIAGEDPTISKEELAQFFKDYSKHFDEDITDSYLIPSIEDEQFMRLLREEVASNLVNVWAETSNGDHPMSHAIQDIAKTVLGVKDSADWEDGKTQDQKDELFNAALDVKENYGEALRAFVKAQYRLTQEWLEERGIEKLVVYRGIKEPNGVDNKKGLVQLRPLSSWSQSQRTALKFTGGTPNPTGGMLKTVIDAKDVFSTPFTGFGCLEEDEIVVIGGKKPAEMRPVKDVWDGWTEGPKAQNDIPVSNAPMSNFAPKKGKGGLSKEIERRQRLAQQQQEEYAKRLEEQEKAKENIKGQVEANKDELERQIPQIAQSLPTTIDDLFDPNYPLNVLNSRDITQEVFGATNSSDIRRPSAVAALEPDQNWKDLIKNLESLGLADAQDIENEVNSKFNASLSDIRRKRKNASESRKTLENALVSVEGKLKAVEDELILNNFGLDRPQSDPATTQGIADVKKRVSDLRAWAEEYYHQKTGQAVDAFSTPSPLFRLVSVFHGQNERSEEIMQGAVSQLSEIGKLQDSRERQKGYDRVIAKIILGTYMLPYSSSFRQSLENLKTSPAVETLLGRKIPALVIDSALNDLKKKFIQLSEDSSKEEQAVKDLSYEVSKIIKEKLTALGVRFKHNVEISASDINYLGTGEIDINALVAGKPKSEWFKRYNTGEIAPHLSTAQSMAAVLTEALQAFPEPVALVIKKFIVEHPEIMFAGGKRGFWSHTPKDRNIDKVQYVDPADEYMSLTLDGRTKERSVNTASHELTHLLVTQILPQLQPVEWAVLSSFVNQYDADGNIKHDLINGNGGDILIGGEISTTSARDASGLAYRAEASVYTPKVASPYSTKYQIFGNIPGLRVNGTTGLMPYGHGEFLSTLTESMFNGSNQVFYGQRGVSPGDRVRIGYNADGTVKYFTIPDSPIFNAGALPVGIAISLLMNQLAKDKLEVI